MASFQQMRTADRRFLPVACALLFVVACAPASKAGQDANNVGVNDAGTPFDAGTPDAGPPPPTALAFTVQPMSAQAGAALSPAVVVTVRDAAGNLVTTASNAITLALAPSGAGGTLAGTLTLTAESGIATFTGLSIQTAGTGYAIVASSPGLTPAFSEPFDITAGPASNMVSTLTVMPAAVQINGESSAGIVVAVLDAEGNPLSGQDVSMTASGTMNVFNPVTGKTDAAGIFSTTLISTVAQAETVTATVGSFTLTESVTFTAGAPAQQTSSLTVDPAEVVADGVTPATLTVTVLDLFGNPIEGEQVTLSAGEATSVSLAATSGKTDASGVFTTTATSQVAQLAMIQAEVGSFLLKQQLLFTAGAASKTLSSFTVAPASVTADGMTTSTLTMTLLDAFSNPVSGQRITLTAGSASVNIAAPSGTTDAHGVYTTTATSTVAQATTVTAGNGGFLLMQPLTFTAGAPVQALCTFTATPANVTADGMTKSTLTVTVLDALGNPVDAQMVTIGSGSASVSIAAPAGPTGTNGVYTTTATSTVAQTVALTATIGSFTLAQPVTFSAGTAVAAHSTIALTGSPLLANGATPATVVVTAADAQGNPAPGAAVGLSVSGTGVSVHPAATQSTGSAGTATFELASTAAGSKTITATVGGVALVQTPVLTVVGAPLPPTTPTLYVSRPECTTEYSNSSPKLAIDSGNVIYVLMNCSGTAQVATSSTGGNTFGEPVSTGITGAAIPEDMAIAAGAAGFAYVVAYTSANTIAYSMTSDGGVTWSAPVTIGGTAAKVSTVYGFATVAVSGSNVYVGYLASATEAQLYVNTQAGVGAFTALPPGPSFAFNASWWRLLADPTTGNLYIANEDTSVSFASSTNGGMSWNTAGADTGVSASWSAWALGGSTIFNAGDETTALSFATGGASGILQAPGTVTPGKISGVIQASPQGTALAADSFGNAYVATAAKGAVTVQAVAAGSTAVTSTGVLLATGGSYPAVSAWSNGGTAGANGSSVVVAWYDNGVQAAVVTPTSSTLSVPDTTVTWGTPLTVTVTANGLTGVPLSGQAVTLSASGTAVTLGAASGTTAADGTWTTTVSGVVPGGTTTLTATVDGLPVGTATVTVGTPPAVAVVTGPVEVDGSMTGCTTALSNTSQKIAVDGDSNIYVLMNCSGTGYVAVSSNGGSSFGSPVSTGISGVTLGTDELQIVGGAGESAYVVGFASGPAKVLFTETSNAGVSWSAPVTVSNGSSTPVASSAGYGLANIALQGSGIFVSYLAAGGPQLSFSTNGTTFSSTNAPDLTDTESAYWRLFYDPTTSTLFDAAENTNLYVSTGQPAQPWGPVLEFAGQTNSTSSWAIGGGYLYNAGSTANVYRISTASLVSASESPTAAVISGVIAGGANETAVAADSVGNGYVTTTVNSVLTVQAVPVNATTMDAPATVLTGAAQPYANIAVLPGVGQVVSYTDSGVVYATVVTAP